MRRTKMKVLTCLLAVLFLVSLCKCDTPANCSYITIEGIWQLTVGVGGNDKKVDCSSFEKGSSTVKLTLLYPDVAVDEFGNKGFWTLIYNQGFEVVIHGRKYFAFSRYENKTSYCSETMPGWSHNVVGSDWACFIGKKINNHRKQVDDIQSDLNLEKWFHIESDIDSDSVDKINSIQPLWKAVEYPEHKHLSLHDKVNMAGGLKSRVASRPKPLPVSEEVKRLSKFLPEEFDWRNVDGINYVSPVRNQGSCGSCYAFSSMGMVESRLRVLSNNTVRVTLSPQDIVDCSEYSQGCGGGFPYLIAGKYATDFGLVLESCDTYTGKETKACHTKANCKRYYSSGYRYVGGYYGGCNEELMKLALYNNGPMSVSFEVLPDFFHYKGGIYQHTGVLTDRLLKFNPFELTNHAVLLVGWGQNGAGIPYWIVKNSWGTNWGEDGYFRIIRGVDECSIESIAVETFPVL